MMLLTYGTKQMDVTYIGYKTQVCYLYRVQNTRMLLTYGTKHKKKKRKRKKNYSN